MCVCVCIYMPQCPCVRAHHHASPDWWILHTDRIVCSYPPLPNRSPPCCRQQPGFHYAVSPSSWKIVTQRIFTEAEALTASVLSLQLEAWPPLVFTGRALSRCVLVNISQLEGSWVGTNWVGKKAANQRSKPKPGHAQRKSRGFQVGDIVIAWFNVSD